MQHKEGSQRAKRRAEGGISTLTGDVSRILRAINGNSSWKNSSGKLNKTMASQKNATLKPTKKNVMTEDEIDQLFNRSKSKSRPTPVPNIPSLSHIPILTNSNIPTIPNIPTIVSLPHHWPLRPARDFTHSVKFLRVHDSTDKLLNGMPL
jgi:hypothetical protein